MSYWRYIDYTDLIRLLKVAIHIFVSPPPQLFLNCRCARHGVTAYMQLRLWLISSAVRGGNLLHVNFIVHNVNYFFISFL
jgi:hypothetical protein